jgi:outer membrane protein OmpA-like peptidoglycan-associated protein/opacity protein-like surface antigen
MEIKKRKGEGKMSKKLFGLSLIIAFLMCMPLSAPAEEEPVPITLREGGFYATVPMGGGIFYLKNSDADLDSSGIVGARLGYVLTEKWMLEASFDYGFTSFNGPAQGMQGIGQPYDGMNANNFFMTVNALRNFGPVLKNKRLTPYVLAGVGLGVMESSLYDDPVGALGQIGGGAHYGLTDNIFLRGEVRALFNTDPSMANLVVQVGPTFHFGGAKPLPPPPPPPVWKDSDGDGVPDPLDKCPGTPKGCIVDSDGCPLDSDADGVCDGLDECPDTPPGTAVDEKGCPVQPEKVTLSWAEGLTFALGSAQLTPQAEGVLDGLVALANKHPGAVIEIGGYTDSTGSAVFNQQLSEKRALSVRNYMVLKGITPDRLKAIGYGETNFVATNDTPEGRQQNRRVEFKFLGQDAVGLPVLHFKVGKSELTEASMNDLNGIAEKLKARPNVRVEIAAYTDSSGSANLNERLSLKRATMVKDMLVAKGVAPENLEAVGRGATNYLTTNATKEGREMNRRVEFTIFWASGW